MPSTHILILAGLICFSLLPLMIPVRFPPEFWIKQLLSNLLWYALFVFNRSVMVPQLLFREKPVLFILAAMLSVVVIFQIQHWIDQWLHLTLAMGKLFPRAEDNHEFASKLISLVVSLIILGVSTISRIGARLQEERVKQQTLESDKLSTELSYLKSQINPHFLFNILHTIYALIETDKSKARESVYTLSHMMRYVLYDTDSDTTLLSKELAMIEDYIALMKLRVHQQVQIIFERPKDVGQTQIAPMLFLPLIENAFKHGVSSADPSYIYVSLTQNAAGVALEVRNSLLHQKAAHTERSNGIGLANTQRRLDLIYPGQHDFRVRRDDKHQEFTVYLTLHTHDPQLSGG